MGLMRRLMDHSDTQAKKWSKVVSNWKTKQEMNDGKEYKIQGREKDSSIGFQDMFMYPNGKPDEMRPVVDSDLSNIKQIKKGFAKKNPGWEYRIVVVTTKE